MGFIGTFYVFLGRFMVSSARWVEAPATSRHTRHSLWLLPSGPDQIHELVLREDQGPHRSLQLAAEEW